MPNEEKEFQERVNKFIEAVGKARQEFQIDLRVTPVCVPTERGTFELAVQSIPMDLTKVPQDIKSPFIQPDKS